MADIQGINVAAPVVPYTTDDIFPTHFAKYGNGGFRTVSSIIERDSIRIERLEIGMVVTVLSESGSVWYELISIPASVLAEANWQKVAGVNQDGVDGNKYPFVISRVTAGTMTRLDFPTLQAAINAATVRNDVIEVFGGSITAIVPTFLTGSSGPSANKNLTIVLNTVCIGNLEVKSGNNVTLTGPGKMLGLLTISGGNTILKNFTIDRSTAFIEMGTAIMYNGGTLTIENGTTIRHAGTFAINTILPFPIAVQLHGILNCGNMSPFIRTIVITKNRGAVATVNSILPDENGNILVEIPEGAGKLYNSLGPNIDGAMNQLATTIEFGKKAGIDPATGRVFSNLLPVASSISYGTIKIGDGFGLMPGGQLRTTAIDYETEIYYRATATTPINTQYPIVLGKAYAIDGVDQIDLKSFTMSAGSEGRLVSIRNVNKLKTVELFDSGGKKIYGQDKYYLEPGDVVWLKYIPSSEFELAMFAKDGGRANFIRTVNGLKPDLAGNLVLDLSDGNVRTVNGILPDVNGNIVIEEVNESWVRTVNGQLPDANGDVIVIGGGGGGAVYTAGDNIYISGTNVIHSTVLNSLGTNSTITAPSVTAVNAGLNLKVNLTDSRLHQYVNGAVDTKYLFYNLGKSYAFPTAGQAVEYARLGNLQGLFVFTADVTEPLELLNGCFYNMEGYDSIVNSGAVANFYTTGNTRTGIKLRRVIRGGTARFQAVGIIGPNTFVHFEGDVYVESTSGLYTRGPIVSGGAHCTWRGNIYTSGTYGPDGGWAFAQHGLGCYTDFVGNITTNTTDLNGASLYCLGGVLDFTGRVDVLDKGELPRLHPDASGNPWLRLNLLGTSSRDRGVIVHNVSECRLLLSGTIDMRDSTSIDVERANGFYVTQPNPMSGIKFANVNIATKPGIPSLCGQIGIVNNWPIEILGTFTASEAPYAGMFVLQNGTPFRFPASTGGTSTAGAVYTSGTNILISDTNVISAIIPAQLVYTAGTAIGISGTVIRALSATTFDPGVVVVSNGLTVTAGLISTRTRRIVAHKLGSPENFNATIEGILNGDFTPHDIIEINGNLNNLYLANINYNVRGYNATVTGRVWMGDKTTPKTITLSGITSPGIFYIHGSYYDNTEIGHVITVNDCNISWVAPFQSFSGQYRDVHTFNRCQIGTIMRAAAYNGMTGHKIIMNQCIFGETQTSNFIFDAYDPGESTLIVRDSTIILKGTTVLSRGTITYPYMQFTKCTVIKQDGTSYVLDNTTPVEAGTGTGTTPPPTSTSGPIVVQTTGLSTVDVMSQDAVTRSLANVITGHLTAKAVVQYKDGSPTREFASYDAAAATANPEDTITLTGHHPEITVQRPANVIAYDATMEGLVLNFLAQNFKYTWRGGFVSQRLFSGRSTGGTGHKISVHDVILGPSGYHQCHTNNTNWDGPADEYTFVNCELRHVQTNQNFYGQYQNVFYDGCSFTATTIGAIFRKTSSGSMFHEQSVVTAINCRFTPMNGYPLFDGESPGEIALQGVSTTAYNISNTNKFGNGLRILAKANPFVVTGALQDYYPVSTGTGGTAADPVIYTAGNAISIVSNQINVVTTASLGSGNTAPITSDAVNAEMIKKQNKPTNNQTFYGFNAAGPNNVSAGGDGLTFIGGSAGFSNSTNNQTMVGVGAGANTTFGPNNTFVGSYSGERNLTGQNNVYLGHFSGRLATGSSNTAIGSLAGQSMTGGENVYVGFAAGINDSTGTGNIGIGAQAGPNTGSLSNTISIGAGAQATASNTMFITNTVNVGIGMQPTHKLSVNGIIHTVSGITFGDGTTQYTAAVSGGGPTGGVTQAYVDGADANLQNNINLKANIFSPALTGTPTAPTAGVGNNTTILATTEFVTRAVSSISAGVSKAYVDAADSNLQNNINLKANIFSPALTGTPTAPTAGVGDNTFVIATTEFVTRAISSIGGGVTKAYVDAADSNLQNNINQKANIISPALQGSPTAPTALDGNISTILATTEFVSRALSSISAGVSKAYVDAADSNLQNNINQKANIFSPALTGTPTAPTAFFGDSTTILATTEFVSRALSFVVTKAYVDGADNNLQNNINLKANIFSPALTGTPTSPTQPDGDNTTKIATNEWVNRQLSTGVTGLGIIPDRWLPGVKLQVNTVSSTELMQDSVITVKILDKNVTMPKLSDDLQYRLYAQQWNGVLVWAKDYSGNAYAAVGGVGVERIAVFVLYTNNTDVRMAVKLHGQAEVGQEGEWICGIGKERAGSTGGPALTLNYNRANHPTYLRTENHSAIDVVEPGVSMQYHIFITTIAGNPIYRPAGTFISAEQCKFIAANYVPPVNEPTTSPDPRLPNRA